MNADPEEREFEEWARRATKGVADSAVFLQLWNKKFAEDPMSEPVAVVQLGLAVLLNKPIIVVLEPGDSLPPPLARLAQKVVKVRWREDPNGSRDAITQALKDVLPR